MNNVELEWLIRYVFNFYLQDLWHLYLYLPISILYGPPSFGHTVYQSIRFLYEPLMIASPTWSVLDGSSPSWQWTLDTMMGNLCSPPPLILNPSPDVSCRFSVTALSCRTKGHQNLMHDVFCFSLFSKFVQKPPMSSLPNQTELSNY